MISPLSFAQKADPPTSYQLLSDCVREYNSFEYAELTLEVVSRLNYLKGEINRLSKENPNYGFKLKKYNIE